MCPLPPAARRNQSLTTTLRIGACFPCEQGPHGGTAQADGPAHTHSLKLFARVWHELSSVLILYNDEQAQATRSGTGERASAHAAKARNRKPGARGARSAHLNQRHPPSIRL